VSGVRGTVQIEEKHHVWAPQINEVWPIAKIGIETETIFGVLQKMKILFGDKTKTYYQLNWSGFNEVVDPLWDNIDKDFNDFIYHLKSTKYRELKKNSGDAI